MIHPVQQTFFNHKISQGRNIMTTTYPHRDPGLSGLNLRIPIIVIDWLRIKQNKLPPFPEKADNVLITS
jgi:hypothetical protein